ncbi:MAG TPA: glycosyltransferase family 87 protein [Verrucomicrobiae bacterium]|nr:glycosyltransferase family 87 protein [Verrucomicrobiae bacterium]
MPKSSWFVVACLLGVAFNCLLLYPALHFVTGGDNDFMNLYAGGVLAGSPDLYNMEAVRRVQSTFWEHPRYLPFTRLPFYAALLSPLRLLKYGNAYRLFQLLSLATVIAIVFIFPARNRWFTAAACCWSLPLLNGFVMGQDVAIVVFVLAIALALLFRGKDFAAGCVLSLCLIKFNLFMALPILILARRMWRLGRGAVAGSAILLAASFVVAGWHWPATYWTVLRFPATTALFAGLPNLRGLFALLPGVNYWQAAATLIAAVLAWIAARRGSLPLALSAVLLCGLLVSHHAFCADAFVVVPAAILLWDGSVHPAHKTLALLLLCPLIYLPLLVMPNPVLHPAIVFLAALAAICVWGKLPSKPVAE